METYLIKEQLKMKSIADIPLRVTFYARVSSESDEQLNSLDNQITYYTNFINDKKNWTYVSGYIDEGISGMSTEKRDNFNRMIRDAKDGKFDLIVTKEISRFARNTLDSIRYIRELLGVGVGIYFETTNICTFTESSELLLTFMSCLAQDELHQLSGRVRFGHQQAIKNGTVLGNSRIFGYAKADGRLVIDEQEAEFVRELFRLYATDEYSMKQLENLFYERGYRNHNGNKIAHSTMTGIIQNPKYKGYYVGNKVQIVDMFTKKQKFLPPDKWVMYKDETGLIVPAIVSEELWDKANEVLLRRSKDVKERQNKVNHGNLLTGKLICTDCGRAYYRRDSKDRRGNVNSKWVCSGKINNGAESCASFAIYESEIIPVIYDVFSSSAGDLKNILSEYEEIFRQMNTPSNIAGEIRRQKAVIEREKKKKSKLLGYNVDGKISDDDFVSMNAECDDAVAKAAQRIAELEQTSEQEAHFRGQIKAIRDLIDQISQEANYGVITKEFVDKYIDKIFVTPVDETTMKLEIRIFTGESFQKMLSIFGVRSGHTFKKMIESYENGMK